MISPSPDASSPRSDGITRVEQGTPAYDEAVIEDIRERDVPRADALTRALDAKKLTYFLVQQSFTDSGELAAIELKELQL